MWALSRWVARLDTNFIHLKKFHRPAVFRPCGFFFFNLKNLPAHPTKKNTQKVTSFVKILCVLWLILKCYFYTQVAPNSLCISMCFSESLLDAKRNTKCSLSTEIIFNFRFWQLSRRHNEIYCENMKYRRNLSTTKCLVVGQLAGTYLVAATSSSGWVGCTIELNNLMVFFIGNFVFGLRLEDVYVLVLEYE